MCSILLTLWRQIRQQILTIAQSMCNQDRYTQHQPMKEKKNVSPETIGWRVFKRHSAWGNTDILHKQKVYIVLCTQTFIIKHNNDLYPFTVEIARNKKNTITVHFRYSSVNFYDRRNHKP